MGQWSTWVTEDLGFIVIHLQFLVELRLAGCGDPSGSRVHSIAFAAALSMSHLLCVGQSLHACLYPPHEGVSPMHA